MKGKDTWFRGILFRIEKYDLTIAEQNRVVAHASRRLRWKICRIWGENYDRLRDMYFEKFKT